MPRLLLISSEFPPGPGGIGNHAWQIALNLHRLGWQMTVLSPQDYAADNEVEKFNAVQPFKIVRVPSGRGRFRELLTRVRIANGLAREQKPDVLVGTGLSGVWVGAATSTFKRIPCLGIAHGSELGVSGFVGLLNRRAFERMNAIVAVSQFTAARLQKAGICPQRLEVITNAADPARFPELLQPEVAAFRARSGFNGGPVLLTVGHVSERKGQETVIRALPRIREKVPSANYVMIGLPTLRDKLGSLAESLGVKDHVRFLGNVNPDELNRWLNCCDLFVMTSRTLENGDCEGFGIAVVEAALCGKPAVVSRQSGLIEAIEESVTGLAVPEKDEQATAEAIISLLIDPKRRQAMGQAARARALREQTWETVGRKYDRLLRELPSSVVSSP